MTRSRVHSLPRMGCKYNKLKINNWKYTQKYPTCIREGQGAVLALQPHSQMIIFVISHRDKNSNPNQMFYSQHRLLFFFLFVLSVKTIETKREVS